jgi:predicted TIM-barrel fold metal-dependent hydrolase
VTSFRNFPKIDAHSHFVTKTYVDAMNKYLGGSPDGYPFPQWSTELHLEFMEKMGIEHTVLSCSSPHINFSSPEVNRTLVRVNNEEGAAVASNTPGKFSLLATLPLPDVASSLAEIAYCCDTLHVDGFTLPTNTKGIYMGVPDLDPVFSELNERRAIVTFHPNRPGSVPAGVGQKLPAPMMEFFFDTTRCLVDLILNGYMTRFPQIKFLVPHCGAALPYIVDRIDSYKPVLVKIGSISEDFDIYSIFASLYFDIAGNSAPHQLRDALDIVDISHFMYAADFPFTPTQVIESQATNFFEAPYLNAEQKQQIYYSNAAALFPKAPQLMLSKS